ncbi:MAG: HK97 family phage prohead protease [Treponema sp.]|nr:HK97 family phage prohead protease [Treponema sp.]
MKKEKRKLSFKDIEVRSSNSEGKKIIEGIIPYNSKSLPIWGTTEIIGRTSFNKTLSDKLEVRAMWNHNDNYILGNTKSDTLILENSDAGLICRCELPNTSYANDLYEIIDRGDVKTMSFGFTPVKWEEDDKGKTRTLKEVQLHEVSFGVPFAAYPESTSLTYMRGLEKINVNIEKLNEVLEKPDFSDDDKLIIKQTVDSLRNLIGDDKEEAVESEPVKTTQEKIDTQIEEPKEDLTNIQLQVEAELAV